jgi:hypothetical protein
MTIQTATGFLLLSALVVAAPAAAADDQRETFMATVVGGANMRLPGTGTFSITMNIDRFTPVEERKRLLTVLKESGKDALLKEMRKLRAGYIVPPPIVRWPSWEVDVASSFDTPSGGRVVRLFTERPIAFAEAYLDTRSRDFEFGVVELRLNEKGEGEGTVIPAASISFDKEGRLVFETTPFATGPYKLIGVREWKKK